MSLEARPAQSFATAAAEVVGILGMHIVAIVGNVTDSKKVAAWIGDGIEPDPLTQERVRNALEIALVLKQRRSNAVIQAWFQGGKELCKHQAPAVILALESPEAGRKIVLNAAYAELSPH